MRFTLIFCVILASASLCLNDTGFAQAETEQHTYIEDLIESRYESWESLYRHLHANPELSLQEKETSARIAQELRNIGFDTTEHVGGYGVVGVYENGEGPTIMVRSDMDALPIQEETGVDFASNRKLILPSGEETYVMHACGHDMHMAVMIGTAEVLIKLKDNWQGTLLFIAQPAEEIGVGAKSMINDGLFERFPRPDFALALHVNSAMASGKVGISHGFAYANVDRGRIVVNGIGGHSAYPDLTNDPIIIASKLVLDLQTIISREISAFDPSVLSVGAIRGGHTANIIPGEVELLFTLRTFKDDVREKIIKRIGEKADAAGKAAGLPQEKWPEVILDENPLPSVYNDIVLSELLKSTFTEILGKDNVEELQPVMYGEDFSMYGRVSPEIPAVLYSVGAINPETIEKKEKGLIDSIPSTHSSHFIPDVEPTMKTGILTMSSAVFRLLSQELTNQEPDVH